VGGGGVGGVCRGGGGEGGGGVTIPISQPICFPNPTSQCSNPIPTSRIQTEKFPVLYIPALFSLHPQSNGL